LQVFEEKYAQPHGSRKIFVLTQRVLTCKGVKNTEIPLPIEMKTNGRSPHDCLWEWFTSRETGKRVLELK
jgi:hypothetical protein